MLNRVGLPFPTPPFISRHVLISSATIIEFPATSSLIFFVLFLLHLPFEPLVAIYFLINFWFELSGSMSFRVCFFGTEFMCTYSITSPLSSSSIDIPSLVVFMRYLKMFIGS